MAPENPVGTTEHLPSIFALLHMTFRCKAEEIPTQAVGYIALPSNSYDPASRSQYDLTTVDLGTAREVKCYLVFALRSTEPWVASELRISLAATINTQSPPYQVADNEPSCNGD